LTTWLLFFAMILMLPSFWYALFWVGVVPTMFLFYITLASVPNPFLFLISLVESLIFAFLYYGAARFLTNPRKFRANNERGTILTHTGAVVEMAFASGEKASIAFICLPDTVDPRELKGK